MSLSKLVCRRWLLLWLLVYCVAAEAQQTTAERGSPRTAVEFYTVGNAAQSSGELFAAIEYYRSAVELNPAYFEPIIALAEIFWLLGEQGQSQQYIDQARRFGRNRVELKILEARLSTSQGNFEAAEGLYREITRREPFNSGALLGRAELAVVRGEYMAADELYRMVIRLEPSNRRALLSRVLLLDLLEGPDAADIVLDAALRHHAADSQTQLLAARRFLEQNRSADARRHAQTAFDLAAGSGENDDDAEQAQLLLAEIALGQNDYVDALTILEGQLQTDPNNHIAWYLHATALSGTADYAGALSSFQRALQIRPFEEIIRIALEDLLRGRFAPEDPQRARFAQYHFERGDRYRERNLLRQAQMEYRRGLQIDPFARTGRIGFADLYLLQGFRSRYLQELEVLERIGFDDVFIQDRIETYRSLQAESVGIQWDVDQFTIARDRLALAIFVDGSASRLDYPLALDYAGRYLREVLQFDGRLDVDIPVEVVADRAAAFAAARRSEADYFLLLAFQQSDRNLQIEARIFSAVSGAEIDSYLVLHSGNDRFQNAAGSIAARISAGLPLRGHIIARRDDNALIGLGQVDGISVGDRLLVIQHDRLETARNMLGYLYNEDDIIGEIEIVRVDDLVAEGRLERRGLFDLFDVGDEIFFEQNATSLPTLPAEALTPLYRRLLTIR